MNNDNPPPYVPYPAGGPSAPSFPSGFSSQPAAFPGSPYQTFPQTYTGGGDHGYYHGPPGPPGLYLTQPGFQEYQCGPPGTSGPWEGPKMYRQQPNHTVFLVEPNHEDDGGGSTKKSCLVACAAALCCCCLWDLLGHTFC